MAENNNDPQSHQCGGIREGKEFVSIACWPVCNKATSHPVLVPLNSWIGGDLVTDFRHLQYDETNCPVDPNPNNKQKPNDPPPAKKRHRSEATYRGIAVKYYFSFLCSADTKRSDLNRENSFAL